MKKYNLSEIMKRAWELVKGFGFGISEALKKAWKEAKEMVKNTWKAIEEKADKYCNENGCYWTVNHWEKGEHDRYYINIFKKNHKYARKAGYWDEKEHKYVAPVKGINLAEV